MTALKSVFAGLQNWLVNTFKLRSLRTKFILSFVALSTIPMVILAIFSYGVYHDILQQNIQSYTSEVIDRVDRNLEIYLSDLERILELRNDYYNLQFIKLSLAGDVEGNRKFTFRLWENLNNIRNYKTELRDVSITTIGGVTIGCYGVTHTDLSQNKLFQTLANRTSKENSIAIWGPHPDWLGGPVFSVGKAIHGDYDNFLGMMSIDVDVELLDRICGNIRLGKTGYIMLVDEDNRIIYHPNPELIGKMIGALLGESSLTDWQQDFTTKMGPGNQLIRVKTFAPANWKIIGLSNRFELATEMQKITGLALTIIVSTILVLTLMAVYFAHLLTNPLKELQQSMRQASEDLNTNAVIHTMDEIGELSETFNQMLARIRQLMNQSVQEQEKMRRTEMRALQEQIKPHFIYNTLDLIIGLLETNKNEDVINTVEALGAFFRTSLSHGQELITIREEVEHVRNYLYIQKIRHGDKYNYVIEVQEQLLNKKTIKLILQPIVENAIYHGVRELETAGGLITIKGFFMEDAKTVCFQVIDNGVGMDPAKMEDINRCLRESGTEQRYFGISNVNERIRLAFGPEYGVELSATPGGGVTVTIKLPVVM
ncbi:cache domain-containing sensor histidine kinase [Capillibacterium thermochitinicola]|nr:sensor histidine kinase [Capillibacterium thermochitinicola]